MRLNELAVLLYDRSNEVCTRGEMEPPKESIIDDHARLTTTGRAGHPLPVLACPDPKLLYRQRACMHSAKLTSERARDANWPQDERAAACHDNKSSDEQPT